MKSCDCCNNASKYPGTVASRTFSISCRACGSRLIRGIRGLRTQSQRQKDERIAKVLIDWTDYGHDFYELIDGARRIE